VKETDLISRINNDLDWVGNLQRQMRFAKPDLTRMLGQTREMDIISKNLLAANELYQSFGVSNLAKELAIASRAFVTFQKSEEFRSFASSVGLMSQVNVGIAMEIARTLGPIRAVAAGFEAHFASQLKLDEQAMNLGNLAHDQNWFRGMESITARIAEMARINFTIPEAALLHWSGDTLSLRTPLLLDCVLNAVSLETFHTKAVAPAAGLSLGQLGIATDFVSEHAAVVRRLPPGLPDLEGDDKDGKEHRNEEIGAKLESALLSVDLRLFELRRKAWGNMTGGVAGARLGMAGIRELFEEVLRILAPESEVEATAIWQARTNRELKKPTRRMRVVYILGEEKAAEADAVFQFEKSVQRTQKFVHTFAEDTELVRAQMTQMEIWIYLLLQFDTKSSYRN
jgi:hypothetical protein